MAITIDTYDHLLELAFTQEIDFSSDALKLVLLANTYTFDTTDTQYSDISSDEIANGNGYVTGGLSLDNVSLSRADDIVKLDADDEQIIASGGAIGTFRYGVIIDDTHANDVLIACIDLGADKTLNDGDDYTFSWDATNGIYRVGKGTIT